MESNALSSETQGRAAAEKIGEGSAGGAHEGLFSWSIASRVSGLLDLGQAYPRLQRSVW
ncbi:hypothetical protein ABIE13_002847 [Ottowia thiooxydans]|uniref:Uncharacterized protein n=1 Tax=Ottowia thiooxydans TaxID=219182 RepID=A0ABV2Q9L0_9BURK